MPIVALANYRTAVLTALGDVENAMAALANTRAREVTLALAVDDSRDALLFAQSQYRAGLVDFQTLLDSRAHPADQRRTASPRRAPIAPAR